MVLLVRIVNSSLCSSSCAICSITVAVCRSCFPGGSISGAGCVCDADKVQDGTDPRLCVCKAGAILGAGFACECPGPNMTIDANGVCVCPTGASFAGGVCTCSASGAYYDASVGACACNTPGMSFDGTSCICTAPATLVAGVCQCAGTGAYYDVTISACACKGPGASYDTVGQVCTCVAPQAQHFLSNLQLPCRTVSRECVWSVRLPGSRGHLHLNCSLLRM